MQRLLLAAWLALGMLLTAAPLSAADELDDSVRQVAKQLRCPICESVSVADSPAELAGQMRAVIRKKFEAGESSQQILDYFAAAYGDSVLLEPPRRGLGWLVWLGPLGALAAGGMVLWLILRAWVRPAGRAQSAAGWPTTLAVQSDVGGGAFTAEARQELDAVRKGLTG